jgi:TPR repeat protein
MNQFKYDIFVSYSRQDSDEVNPMVSRIKEAIPWINIWFDITGIESGDEFEDKIIDAIDNSEIVLFALSNHSLKSEWAKREVTYAKNEQKRVIPILLKEARLTGWFSFKYGSTDCISIGNDLQWNKLIKNLSEWFPDQNVVNDQQTSNSINMSPDELVSLGNKYYDEKNYIEAARYYRTAADQGKAKAQCRLGNCYYYNGDYSEAVRWYRLAAEQGCADAQYQLGNCYYSGYGVEKDYVEAVTWYGKAADQGLAKAQGKLGDCYYSGEGVAKDFTMAVQLYRKSADQGNEIGQNGLGNCYYFGLGVTQDYSEAVQWYCRAGEQGYVISQMKIADCYSVGKGVPQNYSEAAKWYLRAADQGDMLAQYKLGYYYYNGIGVPENYTESVKWYRKAANQGDIIASGILCDLGEVWAD